MAGIPFRPPGLVICKHLDNTLSQWESSVIGILDKPLPCILGVLLGIDTLAMAGGQIHLVPGIKTYGMAIREWVTPFGSIYMKTHPLFSHDITTRNMMVLLEPKELGYRYIDDTAFYGETSSKTHSEGYGQRL